MRIKKKTSIQILAFLLLLLLPISALAQTYTWTAMGSLNTARYLHTASVLADGRVLVAGGYDASYNTIASAELYDPATGLWTATGSLNTAHTNHTASVLADGRVLVAGGYDGSGSSASAELYDPATGLWTATGSLNTGRHFHTASVLADGRVLVAGGYDASGYLASAELYDPATGVWTATGSLNTARRQHTASVLADGRVLVAGGRGLNIYSASAELYDPATGLWTATGSLNTARRYHTASVLADGRVLVAGGSDGLSSSASAELYDPATGLWTATGSLNTGHYDHTASVLADGHVLVAAGIDASFTAGASAELFDGPPACIQSAQSGNWSAASTWVGGSVPGSTDAVCVQSNHTVTLAAAAAADSLVISSGGVLDLATYAFTVENGVTNEGAIQQTQNVDGSVAVNFLQIQPNGGGADQYRGVDIVAGTNLGTTVVQITGNTAVCNNNDGGAYRDRCFMVNPVNAGSVSITLHTTPGEDDLTDDAFFQYASGTTWTQGASCNDAIGAGGACTGTATFASPAWFLIGSGGNAPTAVSLQTVSVNSQSTNLIFASILGALVLGLGSLWLRRRQMAKPNCAI
ncbi:MAG: hypothetical protein GY792_07795 [Gammaproteobacteria bacterium]|nr:hypothetical protein [Gammaproteobacteria bacterium]